MPKSRYIDALDTDQRSQLEERLLARQSRHSFVGADEFDVVLDGALRPQGLFD